MLPPMPEPAGGLAGLDCFVAILCPLPEFDTEQKLDTLAEVALIHDDRLTMLENQVAALYRMREVK